MDSEDTRRSAIDALVKSRDMLAALPVPTPRCMWVSKRGLIELGGDEKVWESKFGSAEAGLIGVD